MKKFIACVVLLTIITTCCIALAACNETVIGNYYGKTFTYTGKALEINWEKVCQIDPGPDNKTLTNQKEYSYKQILEKYWDRMNLENSLAVLPATTSRHQPS